MHVTKQMSGMIVSVRQTVLLSSQKQTVILFTDIIDIFGNRKNWFGAISNT